MKLTCSKIDLIRALRIVGKGVAPKPETPILSGIYIQALDNHIELQATNYEIGFRYELVAEVEEIGQIAVSGRYFQEVINKLPGDIVTIYYAQSERIVHIESDHTQFTLLSMDPTEFPKLQPISGTLSFTIASNTLADLIKKTVFTCSTDDGRPVFTGCLLRVDGATISMVATNTHCLALKTSKTEQENGQIQIIIPSKILHEIKGIQTGSVPVPVKVTCSYNQISFETENLYVTSRLIEGQFPDYNRVIPPSFQTKVLVKTSALAAAVDRVSLISQSDDYNIIKMNFEDGHIQLTSNSPEIGEAREELQAQIDGPGIRIAFNAQYLKDVLKVIDSENCLLGLNQPLSPAGIREDGSDDFIYVVTPVRTR
ncbi:MAG: DNA polymerase III subunit beta [Selenomonadaceae bacterium]|nr:DNA polymerase III subunit beta [Selenomonadaceae bacterium]